MRHAPDSHKGDNGKVAVIGGSRTIYGAPLLSALAAEKSGVDLLYLRVPACHAEIAKQTSLNFQIDPFEGDELQERDVKRTLELLATMDTAVLGPGIARTEESIAALEEIIASASCTLILDATALQPQTIQSIAGKQVILTPHRGELERMEIAVEDLEAVAQETGATIILKGQIDTVVSPKGGVDEVHGGNAGLTVGGTGDALAGLIAGLVAQKVEPHEACILATTAIKKAGELLATTDGEAYSAKDVIGKIPEVLHILES